MVQDLRSLDLNLLLSLEALLAEGNVTRAAQRLGLSQPALSGALARLRRHFDDELLVRIGGTYRLTPLGTELRDRTGAAVRALERVFSSSRDFDAATSQRAFTVLASDYAQRVLGEHLGPALARQAPGVRLELRGHGPDVTEAARELLLGVDALVFPRGYLTDLPSAPLFADSWRLLVWDAGAAAAGLTLADLGRAPWVVTFRTPASATPPIRQLEVLGISPDVRVVLDSFSALPSFLVGTERVALVQTRLALRLERWYPVRALPCPFPTPPLAEDLWWHPAFSSDPAHVWLRGVLAEAGAAAGPVPPD